MRVVSVLPSATEIVCALGHRADLIGRSEECDHPAEVASLPVVMRARVDDRNDDSGTIDDRVKATRSSGESLYELDVPRLAALRPDLLITQDLCGVCSVTEAEVATACALVGLAPKILSLSPRTLEEVWASVGEVAEALGDAEAGERLEAALRQRAASPAPLPGRVPLVAVVEWLDPPILAGLWAPELVRAAGGDAIGPCTGEHGIRTSWNEIARYAPDLVVLSPCSFSVERTERELADPLLRAQVDELAPRFGTWIADEAYFSRPGPRLAETPAALRSLLARRGPSGPMPLRAFGRLEVARA